MTNYQQQFQRLLRELFQFDSADLDFGIYAILNQRREQIADFIDNRLPEILQAGLQLEAAEQRAAAQEKLAEAREQMFATLDSREVLDEHGNLVEAFKPMAGLPVVKNYFATKAEIEKSSLAEDTEAQIYNDLYRFFSRYYDDGDFVTKRRFGQDKYALPYNGQEVYLHWANADQYYIKSGEHFTDYSFTLPATTSDATARVVFFKLQQAEVDRDNTKSDDKRFFVLHPDDPFAWNEIDRTLTLNFEYRALTSEEKERVGSRNQQDKLNDEALAALTETLPNAFLKAQLSQPDGDDATERPRFIRHLNRYTARNTRDFFIHKNLAPFLRQELDYFLKNEVLNIDDIDLEHPQRAKLALTRVKVIRQVGHHIIAFLAQIENFQKRLFEKRKFIRQSDYCLTLDKIPESVRDEVVQAVLASPEQLQAWRELYALTDAEPDLLNPHGDLTGIDENFLTTQPHLLLDTAFLPTDVKAKLLAAFDNLDEATDGILIEGENYQALNLLLTRYFEQVKCIYIDPPYNTGNDEFIYKDTFQRASWLTMLENRLQLAHRLLTNDGTIGISIDINEIEHLLKLLDAIFGNENRQAIISIKRGSITGPKVINPGVVNISEFLVIYSKNKPSWKPKKIYRERKRDTRYNTFIVNRHKDPSEWEFKTLLEAFADHTSIPKNKLKKVLGKQFESKLQSFVFDNAEAVARTASLDVDKRSKEAIELKQTSRNNPDKIYKLERDNYDSLYVINGERFLFYSDRLVTIGSKLVAGELIGDIWTDTLPNDLHNEGQVTLKKGKKPEKLISRLIEMSTEEGDLVLDFFAGSGTACGAAQKMKRRWIGIEFNQFNTLIKRRMINTLSGDKSGISSITNWQGGGSFTYKAIESYEEALTNIGFKNRQAQPDLFSQLDAMPDYQLHYMLDFETEESATLLKLAQFNRPFDYRLKDGPVDLVATFNFLLGLRVQSQRTYKWETGPVVCVVGLAPDEKRVGVIWRNAPGPEQLDAERAWLEVNVLLADLPLDTLYINGDSVLPHAQPLEPEFKRLMFASVSPAPVLEVES